MARPSGPRVRPGHAPQLRRPVRGSDRAGEPLRVDAAWQLLRPGLEHCPWLHHEPPQPASSTAL
eukprot:5552215-Heterocapsa_arctica.AAC.1